MRLGALVGYAGGVAGSKTLIDHPRQNHLVGRMGHQLLHLLLNAFFLMGQQFVGPVLPGAGKVQGLVDNGSNSFAFTGAVSFQI
jgi:hypothetical protein